MTSTTPSFLPGTFYTRALTVNGDEKYRTNETIAQNNSVQEVGLSAVSGGFSRIARPNSIVRQNNIEKIDDAHLRTDRSLSAYSQRTGIMVHG